MVPSIVLKAAQIPILERFSLSAATLMAIDGIEGHWHISEHLETLWAEKLAPLKRILVLNWQKPAVGFWMVCLSFFAYSSYFSFVGILCESIFPHDSVWDDPRIAFSMSSWWCAAWTKRSASTPSENKTMTIQRTIFASYALHFPSLAWPNLNIYVYWRHCRVTKVFHVFSTCQTTNSCTRASHGLRRKINGQNHVLLSLVISYG